jgi:hypothetical protein
VQRRDVEGTLHEPQAGRGDSYQRVSGPAGYQRGGVTGADDLDRAPGEGIGDPGYQAGSCSGQDDLLVSRPPRAQFGESEGEKGYRSGRERPVCR